MASLVDHQALIPSGARLATFEVIDSTNVEAARRYAAGERGPLWLWAKAQSAGRGRLAGRSWASPPGNLYCTLLETVAVPARSLSQVGIVTALAVVDAVRRLASEGLPISLKWPNDVLVGGRKIAGILAEGLGGSDEAGWTLAIGCGLNLAEAPEGVRFPATSLARCGVGATPKQALAAYAPALEARLAQWARQGGFAAIRRDWLALGPREGSPLKVSTGGAVREGRFAGLGPGGELRLALEGGGVVELYAGDVEAGGVPDARP
jgi:BirA family biotin operon repressor/biotin-[acetyl-CoA-carboxylase] ligase